MNQKSAAAFGIAGFVLVLLSLLIPIYGYWIGAIALAIVAVGGFYGERVFAIATVILSLVKLMFLSPTAQLVLRGDQAGTMIVFSLLLHALPIAAIVIAARRAAAVSEPSPEKPNRPY